MSSSEGNFGSTRRLIHITPHGGDIGAADQTQRSFRWSSGRRLYRDDQNEGHRLHELALMDRESQNAVSRNLSSALTTIHVLTLQRQTWPLTAFAASASIRTVIVVGCVVEVVVGG